MSHIHLGGFARLVTCSNSLAGLLVLLLQTHATGALAETVMLNGQEVHPSRILAMPSQTVLPNQQRLASAVARPLGTKVTRPFSLLPELEVIQVDAPDFGSRSLSSLKISADPTAEELAARLQERIDELTASGLYDYVEPDYVRRLSALPADSALGEGKLWGLRNTGQNGGVAGIDINAPAAWDITTGSTDVIVAVVDSGTRYTHQDLATQMWRNPGESGGGREANGIDDDGNGYVDDVFGIDAVNNTGDPNDVNRHGTHCAGTIGASANDSGGHVGVAWQVRLMACRAFAANGNGFVSDSVKAVEYAVSKKARIINASYGSTSYSFSEWYAMFTAGQAGVMVVASAGNEGKNSDLSSLNLNYPAGYTLNNVVAVAAVDRRGNLASFSNYGADTVDLAAPGVDIYSTVRTTDASYENISGTSMATPHVTGVAALLLARYPSLTVSQLRSRLINTTRPLTSLAGRTLSGGLVDAAQALTAQVDGTMEVAASSDSELENHIKPGQTVKFTVRITDLDDINNATVTGQLNGQSLAFGNAGVSGDLRSGDNLYTASVTAPDIAGEHPLTITASAPGKTTRTFSKTYTFFANDAFASPTILPTALPVRIEATSSAASLETNEPKPATKFGKTLWWSWTAPTTQTMFITTRGSSLDTILAVYTGTRLDALSRLATSDDYAGSTQSLVRLNAISGTTYHIQVGGYDSAGGIFSLALFSDRPANDDFTNAPNFVGGTQTADNTHATIETGEKRPLDKEIDRSLWWRWTAPRAGRLNIDTRGSDFDTILAVYTAANDSYVGFTTERASNDDSDDGIQSQVSLPVTAGTTYHIQVSGYAQSAGTITLNLRFTPDAVAPTITSATSARFIAGQPGSFTVTATGEPAPTLGVTSLPAWATFDPATGAISGTPSIADLGTYSLVFTASNATAPIALQVFTLEAANRYRIWRDTRFTSDELADPALSGPDGSVAPDGVKNLLRFALGYGPRDPLPPVVFTLERTNDAAVFTYRRPATNPGVIYAVERSADLTTWTTDGIVSEPIATTDGIQTWEARTPDPGPRIFMRLRVTAD
jgi:subtilisin family serine protease